MADKVTVKTFPFATGAGANVTEADWRDMTQRFAQSGVARNEGSGFSVDPGTGMSVIVHPGHAFLIGHYVKSEADETLTLQAADASNPRIDLICAFVDMVNREGGLKVLTGTPAANPVAPTPNQVEGSLWEEPLWEVHVAAGATGLTSGDFTKVFRYVAPIPHAPSHASDGNDPITPADIGAAPASHVHPPTDITPQGSGSGLDADAVDGRHAAARAMTNLAWVDVAPIDITAGWKGWLPIAFGNGRRSGHIIIADSCAAGCHNIWHGDVHNRYGRVLLRERGYLKYHQWVIYALRVIIDDDNPVYGAAVIQAYVINPTNAIQRIWVFQRHDMAGIDAGQPWAVRYCPDEVPANIRVLRVQGAGNGSHRLARALTGSGATTGLQSPAQMQALFPPDNPSGANPASVMDGDTSTGLDYDADATFIGASAMYVDRAVVTTYVTNNGGGTIRLYGRLNSSDEWTQLASTSRSDSGWLILDYNFASPQNLKDFYITVGAYHQIREFQISIAASLIIRGLPLGSTVRLLDGDGNTLESVRNGAWIHDAPVMLTTDVANVAEIAITKPDGSLPWLRFPKHLGTIDGGMQNGDVLTLYREW